MSGLPVTAEDYCFHCTLPIPVNQQVIKPLAGKQRHYCCNGCSSVSEAIFNAGLEGFYKRRLEGDVLAPPPELPSELAFYDLDEIQQDFVDTLSNEREIHLLVEGIHCAACVWLIENSLRREKGILEAKVNLTGKRLKICWDNNEIKLSAMIQRLGLLGYGAVPYDPETVEGHLKQANRQLLYRMSVAGFAMMNLLWISIALYTGADKGEFRTMFHWIGFCLATPTLIYSGYPFYLGAWQGIKNRVLGMDFPIALGASTTYLYSVYVTFSGTDVGEVYFDTVVNFLFVILVGRFLEAISKRKAVASTQRLLDLQPRVATLINDEQEQIVAIRSVLVGDLVLVKPGARLPVDGVVVEGATNIDESMLTGESEPVSRSAGQNVCAGTINGNGALKIRVTGLLNNSALGRIIHLVEEAQASKAPIQCIADRIVPWFVAATLGLAFCTFSAWLHTGIEQALMAATAVLIITCPCAFGLATPMSIAVASGVGARHGILIRNGEVLERFSSINHFVFDKTGTLTEGVISVTEIHTEDSSWQVGDENLPAAIISLMTDVAAAEGQSEHPIATAVKRFAEQSRLNHKGRSVGQFAAYPGYGIGATIDGHEVLVGNRAWLDLRGIKANPHFDEVCAQLDRQGRGSIRCAYQGNEVAIIGIEDRLRDEAPAIIQQLKSEGMKVTLLSGDRRSTAEFVAARLGGMDVIAEVLPEDKDKVISDLQANGDKVVMVGDGVNDAPALVRADVGVALGSGTDVSIASADIVLMSSELSNILMASRLSRRALKTIHQNIAISISYNLIMVPLAMLAYVTPLVAAISMPISSLLVIANAARIGKIFSKK
ncbi:MAG: heavy metal translocating P-type ATPase [Motiliproteus sp.]